jgi:flagellar biosynthesis chaperone FliJ
MKKGEEYMTKKYLIRAMTICAAAVMGLAAPKVVKADALPCTVEYLNQARTAQSNATAELAAARAELADIQARVDAFVASGDTASSDYFNAATALLAAKGKVEQKQQELSSANSFVKDCESTYIVEDRADKAFKALQSVNLVGSSKLEYDNAVEMCNNAARAVEDTRAAIAGYQAQLATSPSVQAQIDALNSQLASLEADLNQKAAVVDQKKAAFAGSLNSNYTEYDKSALDYIFNRGNMRDHTVTDLDKDGDVDGDDYFIGVGYVQGGNITEPLYRWDHYIEEARNYSKRNN